MVLLIDNYDSFSYNLFQMIGEILKEHFDAGDYKEGPDSLYGLKVIRNDEMTVSEIEELNPEIIIISPGPGKPSDAGICEELIKTYSKPVKMLGVCLGHQAIFEAFGGKVGYAKELMHGKQSIINFDKEDEIFAGIEEGVKIARYHSLAGSNTPACLKVIAATGDGEIMAVRHREKDIVGLQFHPESVLTENGREMLENFIFGNTGKNVSKKKENKKMINEAIKKLVENKDLSYDEAYESMDEIFSGEVSETVTSSYLTALRMKGETVDEITASAKSMRAHAENFPHEGINVLEIVGTGGDCANSFNISTTSAFVAAAGGVPVAKHGNRSVSSKSGAADVLEALGADITITPDEMSNVLKNTNMSFMFAQGYHKAMKYVGPVRKALGIRTIFNILGPLTNPAEASMQLLGVYDKALVEPMAKVLSGLGVKDGMAVYGEDCLDEISMSAPTYVCEIRNGDFKTYTIEPEQFGYKKCTKDELVGGDPKENAEITRKILSGEDKSAKREAVCLNAGAALYIAKKADNLEKGVRMAEELIDSGKAYKAMEEFIAATNK